MDKKLEVGDVLYFIAYRKCRSKMPVTRVTEKRAFVKINERCERQFHRTITMDNGFAIEVGASTYSRESAYVETEELKERYSEQADREQLELLLQNPSRFTPTQVRAIIKILTNE